MRQKPGRPCPRTDPDQAIACFRRPPSALKRPAEDRHARQYPIPRPENRRRDSQRSPPIRQTLRRAIRIPNRRSWIGSSPRSRGHRVFHAADVSQPVGNISNYRRGAFLLVECCRWRAQTNNCRTFGPGRCRLRKSLRRSDIHQSTRRLRLHKFANLSSTPAATGRLSLRAIVGL